MSFFKLNLLFLLAAFSIISVACGSAAAKNGSNVLRPEIEVDTTTMQRDVEHLASLRPFRDFESLTTASDYIFKRLEEYGLNPTFQYFSVGGNTYRNVIVFVGPKNAKRVVVGAHYDVAGEQPGADDNASGLAGLLELARHIAEYEKNVPLKIGFEFVAFALEEPPFFATEEMGSYIHAKSLAEAKVDVIAMLSLEMIGYFSDEEDSQKYPFSLMSLIYPSEGDFIGVISTLDNRALGKHVARHLSDTSLPVERLVAPDWLPGVDFSDHRNYPPFGFPAVMVTDTAFYRNPNYHEATDTPNTLDYVKMGEVVRGVFWALINF